MKLINSSSTGNRLNQNVRRINESGDLEAVVSSVSNWGKLVVVSAVGVAVATTASSVGAAGEESAGFTNDEATPSRRRVITNNGPSISSLNVRTS
jgi:hypothetical protein